MYRQWHTSEPHNHSRSTEGLTVAQTPNPPVPVAVSNSPDLPAGSVLQHLEACDPASFIDDANTASPPPRVAVKR